MAPNNYISCVNELQDELSNSLTDKDLNIGLPQIVVVGNQSEGKSSVLDSLTGKYVFDIKQVSISFSHIFYLLGSFCPKVKVSLLEPPSFCNSFMETKNTEKFATTAAKSRGLTTLPKYEMKSQRKLKMLLEITKEFQRLQFA